MKFIDIADKYNANTAGDIIAAKKDNRIVNLNTEVGDTENFEFIDTASLEGIRIYRNTLKFVLVKAVAGLFPRNRLKIHYSINKGSFCELIGRSIGKEDVNKIRKRMRSLIKKRHPIERHDFSLEHAAKVLGHTNRNDLLDVLSHDGDDSLITLYSLEGVFDYFHGVMAPDTGYVDLFELRHFHNGFLLFYPTRFEPGKLPEWQIQDKLTDAFEEFRLWGNAIGVDSINDINLITENGDIGDIIRISEALQEKKIGYIADEIMARHKNFVFIAGPSSSGKTTFARRLAIHLRAVGLKAHPISLDDYYKGSEVPLDIFGKKDYETPDAFDIEKFSEDMKSLQEYGYAQIPEYDFTTESRKAYRDLSIDEKGVVIVEGIHGINPDFSNCVDRSRSFKLYISALTSINIDDHNRLSTTDARLFRRLVRDFKYRGASAKRTLSMWADVRKGEDKYIFPYQEEADIIFNSTLIYEHGVLKKFAVPILSDLDSDNKYYSEAQRLLEIMSYFTEVEDAEIPNTSLIREFIGGSVLKY
ncbi:MAG: nucleoside kinase [Clostridiales bacterium]|nr:nucleoside kinase [Clostridiales bacterium]